MKSKSIEWLGGSVRLIDQTKLPLEEFFIQTSDWREIAGAIRGMKIRGAPAIGIAAAYAVALAALETSGSPPGDFERRIDSVIAELASTRPTAVNLTWALERMKRVLRSSGRAEEAAPALVREAVVIHEDDRERCRMISRFGATLIGQGSRVLTHCNTGALATGGEGTALGIILEVHRMGRVGRVYFDETRPLLQGARLTAWELMKEGVEATLITDSTAASLMAARLIDTVVVGADRIAANGDTANKVGTYALAVLARHHGIPLYVAAPTSTIDPSLASGSGIPIEERPAEELTVIHGRAVAPPGVRVYNPAFDVTPGDLITAIVTEEGIEKPPFDFSSQGRPPRRRS